MDKAKREDGETDSNGESYEFVDSSSDAQHPVVSLAQSVAVTGVSYQAPVSAAAAAPTSFPPPPLPNPYSIRSTAPPPAPAPPPSVSFVPMPPGPAQISPRLTQPPTSVGQNPVGSDIKSEVYEVPLESVPLSTPTGGDGQSPTDGGMWGWFQGVPGGGLLSKFAEKSQVDNVITTLDPQMKEFLHTSGTVELVVASDKEVKIAGIREGFLKVYATAQVRGLGSPSVGQSVPAQPVGFAAAMESAKTRIQSLRESRLAPPGVAIVAVEGFLMELSTDDWHDFGLLLLEDPTAQTHLHVLTQSTPVPLNAIKLLKERTPLDQQQGGFANTIGEMMGMLQGCSRAEWHQRTVGRRRIDLIANAAAALAFLYRTKG